MGISNSFRAAPGDETHIAIDNIVGGDDLIAGGVNFSDSERNLEAQQLRRLVQALGMFRQLENLFAIDAKRFSS